MVTDNRASSLDTPDAQGEKPLKKDWPIPVLKEGLHYYMEDGFMVFAEAYHLARGRCCGNACRHCPFEHENVRR